MYRDFINKVDALDKEYERRGIHLEFEDSPLAIVIRGDLPTTYGRYIHHHDGTEYLLLVRGEVHAHVQTYPKSKREASPIFELPDWVSIGNWRSRNRDVRKSKNRKQIESALGRVFEGCEFPFGQYTAEAEDIKYLLWGRKKIIEFLSYVGKAAPKAIGLINEFEGLKVMSAEDALEILDGTLNADEIKARISEATKADHFELASYLRDLLSSVEGKK